MIDEATREQVRRRAQGRCEYCRVPESAFGFRHSIDHIVAKQHSGSDAPENLALCCMRCNRKKGPNVSGVDPDSKTIAVLFNPRRDQWSEHFRWLGPNIAGATPQGRATVAVLDLNHTERIKVRQSLFAEGLLPA